MIPLTHETARNRCSRRITIASGRIARFVLASILSLNTPLLAYSAAEQQKVQDSSAKPAPVPATQPQTGSANSSAHASDSAPLKKAVHQKKVITEDDLAKPEEAVSLSDMDGEENNPACDHACEAQLRAEMGFGPEREAEFRNQLTLARHDISYDKVWTSTLQEALQAANEYCDIQRQVDKIVGKGASEYTRNDVHSRFAERENKLKSQYRNAAGMLTQHIETVQRFAPFRATIMQYQWNGAAAHACPDYTLP